MSTRHPALEVVSRGWHVFALPPGKKSGTSVYTSTCDPSEVSSWPLDANYGIHPAPSGLYVVDLDRHTDNADGVDAWMKLLAQHGMTGLRTFTVRTPSGGIHLYFRAPSDVSRLRNSASSIAPGIDTRWKGGYVVGPGSKIGKNTYSVVDDSPIVPMPGWLITAQARPGSAGLNSIVDGPLADDAEALEQVRQLVDELASTQVGANDKAASIASKIGGLVGAGQVETNRAWTLLISAFDGWAWAKRSDMMSMYRTCRDQFEWGISHPRPWVKVPESFEITDDRLEISITDDREETPWSEDAGDVMGVDEETAPKNLPDSFWNSRPCLRHIRQAADSRMCSPDAVLGAVLARLSSFMPPSARVETGISPASLNLYAAILGISGAGKSQANDTAQDLLSVPIDLAPFYKDALTLGSGEGIAEAFYGYEDVSQPGPNGKEKTVKQRALVRENVSFYVDEGEMLSKVAERSGNTTYQVLRTAWVGGSLGQANASSDRNRDVPRGAYSLGLVIGYQHTTVQPLLADGGGGTPQRFLFLSSHSEPPEDDVQWPGELFVQTPQPWKRLELPQGARNELRAARRAAMNGAVDPGMNGQEPLHLAKVSTLLAILDGRDEVTMDDWSLAHQLWATSCAVRDGLAAMAEAEAARVYREKDEKAAQLAGKSAVAERKAVRQFEDAEILKVARWIGLKVKERAENGGEPWKEFGKKSLAQLRDSRSRGLIPDALEVAEERGWIVRDEKDGVSIALPGESCPT